MAKAKPTPGQSPGYIRCMNGQGCQRSFAGGQSLKLQLRWRHLEALIGIRIQSKGFV